MTRLERAVDLILGAVRLKDEAQFLGRAGFPQTRAWCLDQAERSLAEAIDHLDGLEGGAAEGARGAATELRAAR